MARFHFVVIDFMINFHNFITMFHIYLFLFHIVNLLLILYQIKAWSPPRKNINWKDIRSLVLFMILNMFLSKNERGAKQDLTLIKIKTITWAAAQVDML